MTISDRRSAPRHVVIIELDDDFHGLQQLLLDADSMVQVEAMAESPRGYVWHILSADAADRLESEQILTTALQHLRAAVEVGSIRAFRVIVGGGRGTSVLSARRSEPNPVRASPIA